MAGLAIALLTAHQSEELADTRQRFQNLFPPRGIQRPQALVGGAELSLGAWVFMMCIFAGGWMAAWFVRKQWI